MPKVKSDDLIRELYNQIKSMILQGKLSPGEKLTQESLASQLGVSRTPLLRALQLLEGDMLLVSIPRRGMYVRKMTLVELRDAFQLRSAVESMCASLAAKRMSDEEIDELRKLFEPFADDIHHVNMLDYQQADHQFHSLILKGSQNQVVNNMPVVDNILRVTYHYGLIRMPHQTFSEHLKIIDAIQSRNSHEAYLAMKEHLHESILNLEGRIAQEAESE